MKNVVSFVVDALPDHYFKAELLLLSLEHLAQHPKEEILVQCVDRVERKFLSFLERNGYRYALLEPYLDGKYCNKIPQVDALIAEECEGVTLLDIDMIVMTPLEVDDPSVFWAKPVDGQNPPLEVLERIFHAADLEVPQMVDVDWTMDGGSTLATNFNGGYYYIPSAMLPTLAEHWKKWATWLYARPELFDTAAQRNHIDQISMGMGIVDGAFAYRTLPANSNFPTHSRLELRSYQPDRPISVLHYHWLLSGFGLLEDQKVDLPAAKLAIAEANAEIARHPQLEFYADFRRAEAIKASQAIVTPEFEAGVRAIAAPSTKRLKLVLHAGTPKTGTTSLQVYLDKSRGQLASAGICVPEHLCDPTSTKFRWLVRDLLHNDADSFLENLRQVISGVDDRTHTVFLSAEGIFNHWWDFPPEAKAWLSGLGAEFDVSLWTWFREPASFAESLYRQNIKNPRIQAVACYGQDLSFEQMLEDPWFSKHLDYFGFVVECEAILGEGKVKAFAYDGDLIPAACRELGVPAPQGVDPARENTGLSPASIEILRVVNRQPLSVEEKAQALSLVDRLDPLLAPYSSGSLVEGSGAEKVRQLTALMREALGMQWS